MNRFWEIVKKFNDLMKSAIKGPNCIEICKGDCCSIKIDVPKVLAEEYIKRGYASKGDFIRSDVFSFKLRFDEKKGKCFLYDEKLNGCLVHDSKIKPPQCWIYPTNFSHPNKEMVSCKKSDGWRIIDLEKTKEAEKLLQYYVFFCQLEAKKEKRKLKERLSKEQLEVNLKPLLKNTAPTQISGFKDTWDDITILPSEGISLQLKKFCMEHNKKCFYILNNDFLQCKSICDKICDSLIDFLQQNLFRYTKKQGTDVNGEYSLIKLFIFIENSPSYHL
ncbi:MAG: YkgJ family cysteine cluster protein [Promethearchaeota archaeon]